MGSSDDSVHAFKGGMMAVIFLSGLMGGFFPSVFNQHKKALSYLNCFSGGVILSAGLMVSSLIVVLGCYCSLWWVAHAVRRQRDVGIGE